MGPASVLQVCRDLPEQTVSTSTERQTDTDLGQRRVQFVGQIEETIQKCRNSKGFAALSVLYLKFLGNSRVATCLDMLQQG